ncbi:hypothetical protein GCM10018793_34290 [Streptomyces sulfonofaciens]|uniref:Pyrrolo-quinoline quinone repeat domain-containing protein n=1 Tax=Streptomyces sulfonofaciens TaxID=68272 RepID=A0A919G8M2_9ACTN|nr:PQQ-binding-like beta-propeller repeat protein [Streptomyces sulfonofaciens]GHH80060.1 hypothetical protein GCM10018793_34290 [Streptomyces sulfonofaciens]
MTQPPNQPPQGGFGAPQDPQGHGAPPPPPDQPPQMPPPPAPGTPPPPGGPGYGYPQQTPAPGYPQQPTANNPYAQPPQQPTANNPYAQPPQPGPYPQQSGPYGPPQPTGPYGQPVQPGPYGQPGPGYGYPQQPQYPGGPGAPGGGGGRSPFRGKPAAVIGAAVAVLLVAGGVVWAVSGGDGGGKKEAGGGGAAENPGASAPVNPGDGSGDGSGKDGSDPDNLNGDRQAGEDKVLWYKSAPDAPGSGADAPGMWITDKVAVKAAYKQVLAYKVADGTPAYPPITLPQAICAASRQAGDGDKVVVAYKSGTTDSAKCNQLVEIDLNTGKKGWTKKIEEGALFDSTITIELSIVKDTLIVGRSQSGAAFRVSDGKALWTKKEEHDGVCFPGGFTGGDRIIVALSCAAGQESAHERVEELDPASGKVKWTKELPKGWELSRVYSTSPVVLYLTNEDKKQWNISTLKAGSSATRSQVDIDESFAPECGWAILDRDLQGCAGTAADADTLYLPTEAKSGANEIVAVNLASGKEKWRVKAPGDTSMLPMKVQGGAVIAYQEPSYDKGGTVLSIPTGGDHRPKALLQNPQGAAEIENGFFSKAIDYVDGRFYISTTRLTGSDKTQEKLMMAFGN